MHCELAAEVRKQYANACLGREWADQQWSAAHLDADASDDQEREVLDLTVARDVVSKLTSIQADSSMPEFADSDEEYAVGDIWIEILLQEGREKAMRCALFVQAQWRFRLLRHKMRVSMEADASDASLEEFSDICF